MDLVKNVCGTFGIYVSGRWVGNVITVDETEEQVQTYFNGIYPGEDVVVWDNRED
jgi:hypothetical protein